LSVTHFTTPAIGLEMNASTSPARFFTQSNADPTAPVTAPTRPPSA
jgi:hypothetical protein